MNHKQQRVLRYIIIPLSFFVIAIILYLLIGRIAFNNLFADFSYAVVSGEYKGDSQADVVPEDNDIVFSETTEGTLEAEEWHEPKISKKYGEITCERIGLSAPLYYGDSDKLLLKGACQSASSEFPGRGGTTLVGGHDTTFFAPLANAQIGDSIILTCTYGTYEYNISNISIIQGADYQFEELDEGAERLVLYTCYPFGDTNSNRTEKILYTCEKISGPQVGGDDIE